LFTGVRIARAAAAIVSAPPEGLFFHCANRSEAAAVPSSSRDVQRPVSGSQPQMLDTAQRYWHRKVSRA
jgi:hypothetical protein